MTSAAQSMRAVADGLARAPSQLARTGADELAKRLDQELIRATNGDRRLTNLRSSAQPPRVTATDDSATVDAFGPVWAILENGTRDHEVKSRRSRTGAMRVRDQWRAGPFHVRGVRGRHTYSQGVLKATDAVMESQRVQWEAIVNGR